MSLILQPSTAAGAVNYKGTWNATTNSPSLASGVGTQGDYYVVSTGGTTNLDGITDWATGDWAIFNGTAWQKVDNSDLVTSVNGSTGDVTVAPADAAVITSTAVSGLSDEVNLGALTTGILKHTVSGGVSTPATATAGTDYYNPGGTDVALADGGTGASLADPNADRLMFWDDSAGSVAFLTPGSGLSITDTTITVAAASPFDCTVGASGADYATLTLAIAAGKSRFLLIDNVTETGNVTLAANSRLEAINFNVSLNMDTFSLTTAASCIIRNIKIKSAFVGLAVNIGGNNNILEHIYAQWTHGSNPASACDFFGDNGTARSFTLLSNVLFEYGGAYANERSIFRFSSSTGIRNVFEKIRIVATVANAGVFLCASILGIVRDITTGNTGSLMGSATTDLVTGNYSLIENIDTISFGVTGDNCVCNNIHSAATIDVRFNSRYGSISNFYISGGTLTLGAQGVRCSNGSTNNLTLNSSSVECGVDNVEIFATFTNDSSSRECTISDVIFGSNVTISADRYNFSNCYFYGSLTVNSGAILNTFNSCQIDTTVSITGNTTIFVNGRVGATAGGGSNTITLNSGATNCIISNVLVDAAAVDNSANTTNNISYLIY